MDVRTGERDEQRKKYKEQERKCRGKEGLRLKRYTSDVISSKLVNRKAIGSQPRTPCCLRYFTPIGCILHYHLRWWNATPEKEKKRSKKKSSISMNSREFKIKYT